MGPTDRCARVVKKYHDMKICSNELAMAYCDGRITTEHITTMERRARIRQTIPEYGSGHRERENIPRTLFMLWATSLSGCPIGLRMWCQKP
eukprot:9854924-Karenia_brevis.AAC.1